MRLSNSHARLGCIIVFLAATLCLRAEDGFTSLFNGRDLDGWDGKPGWWRVEDGAITAESTAEKPCDKHNYLIWRGGEPSDFELRFEYRVVGGNSGIQFRSREIEDWDMRGYQADFESGKEWTGALFEHERGGIALRGQSVVIDSDGTKKVTSFGDPAALLKHIKTNDWNQYRIVARGPEIQLFINGVRMSHAVDRQKNQAAAKGRLGLQMHPGPPMKVQFRNLRLKEFAPTAGATPAEKLTTLPGFKVDLLYSPAKEAEGSWVSMCIDPKGRLIVSGQYDEGLFRITPPPLGSDAAQTKVEKIAVDLSGAQGLCWSSDHLYALVTKNGKTPSGLYRVRDTDADDRLDTVELLRPLEGGGDHGWHAVLPGPDGSSLYVIAGNNTIVPPLHSSRVPPHWSEDHLLPRMPDAGGHMKGVLAPGGAVYRVSLDGDEWEMIANGFRNIYDAAFNQAGELFTYDADMEWDLGTPWYRPTRICHVISGAEFGWRNGTGKWPSYFPDNLPGILDIGPGSPTGVAFGYGANFPSRYQNALFAADWTFGRIYAVHLAPSGATYRGESEVFLSGVPLPVTDMVVNPTDGALYFITGGWRIQTGLYRVTSENAEPRDANLITHSSSSTLHKQRLELEKLHGSSNKMAVDTIWPFLGHEDRTLRFAARVALEWQDISDRRERALHETNPAPALNALLALARVSSRDEFHRKPADPQPDKKLQHRLLAALERIDWTSLTSTQRTDLLRCYAVCFTRLGPPDECLRETLRARFEAWFPAKNRAVNAQLCELLVYLDSPRVATIALELVRNAPTQEEQLDYIKSLRMLRAGWTPESRREYFQWFHKAASYRGGASFRGFLRMIKDDAVATLTTEERSVLANTLENPTEQSPTGLEPNILEAFAGRENTIWRVDAFTDALETELTERNFDRGRKMFSATACFQCHALAGEGGAVGPDLTRAAGRFSKRDLLEAILEPSKTISDLYQNMVITTRDGESLVGRIVYHLHGDAVNLNPNMLDPAATIAVNRNDILSIEPSKSSPMPEGLLAPLAREEILDLLAYILSGGDSSHSMFVRGVP